MITPAQLVAIMPYAKKKADEYAPLLNRAMAEFSILDSKERMAAFLAQIAHESSELQYVKELASGKAYEGRKDLGNIHPGDGVKFKGRGLIQVTGLANYLKCGAALGLNLLEQPELLETPENACRSAGWFWDEHHLNDFADSGQFLTITRKINGGTNGLAERENYWLRANRVLA